ncbi:uncharacterized protein LOC118419094 [Branchiostoma floridae]|uniref:Uncharacterized protein LOC118419094 n=1 Tax=Branchiostoma floridae TaxID=7739 RepID=A0A9J7LGI0_BRAFL|nr:uncharacterized protein LOC118419094 [Branchiostoma floridae]
MGDLGLEENDFNHHDGDSSDSEDCEDWEELDDQRESVTEAFSWFRSKGEKGSKSADWSRKLEKMPLYPGAQLTYGESMVLIMAFILAHHLTSSAVVALLTLINLHTQWGSIFCASKYIFDKFFSLMNLTFPVTRHYFCRACFKNVSSDDKNCKACNSDLSSSKATFYFLEMSVLSQLEAKFRRKDFYEAIVQQRQRLQKKCPTAIEDITDGLVYKSIHELQDPRNISFLMNTDGIKVFRSSNYGLWPVYYSINELPFSMRTRRENIVFAGLWFGDWKPVMKLFLPPLVRSVKALQNGFQVSTPNHGTFDCKAYLLACTCDLQAKALVMDMVAHNGYFGCAKCLQKGTHEGHRHQFPCDADDANGPLRSNAENMAHGREAFNQKSTVYGIKGPCFLNEVDHFDLIRGMSVDYMHGVLMGVTKALMNLWFKSDRKNPYYCGHHLPEIDSILQTITPPMDIHRTPRGITDHMQHWKASEFRSWLLFYSLPIMQWYLPNVYFENYSLLVTGIHLLLGESITEDNISKAEDDLRQFVEGFQTLYGSKLVSLNVHNLLHYAQTVRELGPLFGHSCFFFEDINGQLLKLIHGTQAVEEQVLRAVAILQKFSEVGEDCFVRGTDARKLYDSLSKAAATPEERSNFTELGHGVYSVGSLKEEKSKPDGTYNTMKKPHMEALMARVDFLPERLMLYQRMMKNGEMVHSRLYTRPYRHNSYTITYTLPDEDTGFGEVLYFVQALTRTCGCLTQTCQCGQVTARHFALVQCLEPAVPSPDDSENASSLFSVPHIHKCKKTEEFKAVKLNEVVGKVVSLFLNGNSYLATFPNRMEKD